jgi:manganese transport protein
MNETSAKTDGRSLDELHGSIAIPHPASGALSRLRAFLGPALLVGVGYMDPGNWGTDLQAGAVYRYGLLWVVALASAMAVVLQLLSARLGLVTGRDLAQAIRAHYPAWTRIPYWLLAELAIIACDLAEVLGSAVAINLLFGVPIFWAVLITAADVFLLLLLQRAGMRAIEAVVLVLVATIALCFAIELFVLPGTRPDGIEIARALVAPGLREAGMATVAVGIIGATVMPHNLYLHSALVQSRRIGPEAAARQTAIRYNTIDTVLALGLAFLVNAAILVLAAIVLHGQRQLDAGTDWIRVAYLTLAPLVGTGIAAALFAVALLASGQSSTITGTLAGQVVMSGFLDWRISPWKRRLVTRGVAILPAIAVIGLRGNGHVNDLLVLSQVVLAMQLPFAMLPLLHLAGDRRVAGRGWGGAVLIGLGWASAAVIIGFDLYGLPGSVRDAARILAG